MSDPNESLKESADRIKSVADGLADWWRGDETHETNNGTDDLPSPANLLRQLQQQVNEEVGDLNAARAEAVSASMIAVNARDASLLFRGVWATPAAALGNGVQSVVIASATGSDGSYDAVFAGGGGGSGAQGKIVKSGATAVYVPTAVGAGYTTAPTVSAAGLTLTASAVIGPNVNVGELFSSPDPAATNRLQLYRVDAGPVAVKVGTPYASSAQLDELGANSGGVYTYSGVDDLFPVLVDLYGRKLISVSRTHGTVQIRLAEDDPGVAAAATRTLGVALPALWRIEQADNSETVLLADLWGRKLLRLDHVERALYAYGAKVGGGESLTVRAPTPLDPVTAPLRGQIDASIGTGQSLSVGATAQPAISLTQPYANITFGSGPKSSKAGSTGNNNSPGTSSVKPLVEDNLAADGGSNRGETYCSGLANSACDYYAIENGGDPTSLVVFASTAGHGGYRLDELDFGASWSQVWKDHVQQFAARCAGLGKVGRIQAIPYVQGEADSAAPGNYAAYYNRLLAFQADAEAYVQAQVNLDTRRVPFILYQTGSSTITNDGDVVQAQLQLCIDYPDRFRLAGPIYQMPRTDGTHLSAAGYRWMGRQFGRDFKHLVVDRVRSQFIRPVSATIRGAVVLVRFDSLYPLILDHGALASTLNSGFQVRADGSAVAINSVRVVDGRTVRIELSATPSGSAALQVRYALDNLGTGLSINNGGSGNLRDLDPEVWTVGGVDYPMFRLTPHFKMPVTRLA
ncbi:hypothetical protein ED208_12695 [Stagnimonas aquatica]|uniref:Sialate O-acetylesterase domain-containing protein n=1 Tax=Stagnimonas aquatica TaxID=2689987 RepID=A0A3N0V7S4_9GAMM|nr:hypothetical protein [Stagnimonas aquatica]ROH88671.1 hypothetical protein ED208_12695 [Stagnimonas aquatica]